MKPVQRVKLVASVSAVCLLGDAALYMVLPIYWHAFGLDALWQIGVLLAANRLIRIPIHPLISKFYQTFSIRAGLLWALLIAVVSTAAYGLAFGFWWLLIARFIWGTGWALLKQAGQLTLVDYVRETGEPTGKITGVFQSHSMLGSLFGLVIGSVIVEWFGREWYGLLFAVAALVMIPFVLRHMDRRVASGHASDSTAPAPVPWQVTARALLPVFATVFMLSFLAQGLFSSTVTYWIEKQQINELLLPGGLILGAATWAAALYLLRGALDPWIAPQIGAFSDKKNRRQTLLVGTAIAAGVLYLLIPQELPPWLWLFILLLILISATMLNTLQEALFIDQTARFAHAKHSLISAYSMCSDVGAAAGPIVAYLLITFVHGESVLWLIAALLWSAALIWHRSRPSLHVPFHA